MVAGNNVARVAPPSSAADGGYRNGSPILPPGFSGRWCGPALLGFEVPFDRLHRQHQSAAGQAYESELLIEVDDVFDPHCRAASRDIEVRLAIYRATILWYRRVADRKASFGPGGFNNASTKTRSSRSESVRSWCSSMVLIAASRIDAIINSFRLTPRRDAAR